MMKELFYEIKSARVLLYDTNGLPSSWGEEPHLRYLTQAKFVAEGTSGLEMVLKEMIAEKMQTILRRIKHRDTPTFEYTAVPINRGTQLIKLPTISGHYANQYYQQAEERSA